MLMAWMYLTPIIYPESIVPERYRPFINANPFTALVRSYRRIFLEGAARRLAQPRLLHRRRLGAICLWLLVVCQDPAKFCRRDLDGTN